MTHIQTRPRKKRLDSFQTNQRKKVTLSYLSRRDWTTPMVLIRDLKPHSPNSTWFYLQHLYKQRLVRRGRNVQGNLVYRLSPKGAKWLLRNRDLKV